jgi:hypothetical protein
MLELFGKKNIEIGTEVCDAAYRVIAVYPEWNLIFLIGEDKSLLAYDMNHSKVHVLPPRSSAIPEVPGNYYYERRTSLSSLCSLVHGIINRAVKVHMLYFIVIM